MTLLQGEKVRLTALTKDDAREMVRWYQDVDFMRLYDAEVARPKSLEQVQKQIEAEQGDQTLFLFAIRPAAGQQLIGTVGLEGILWTQGTAWLNIAIGDMAHRGKGYGTAAMRLMLDYAFDELNLYRIQLTVFAYNERAIALYEKLGFQREGAFREFLHRNGQRYDMILFGLLRHEWQSSQQAS